jgi:hypothetical protein
MTVPTKYANSYVPVSILLSSYAIRWPQRACEKVHRRPIEEIRQLA